MFKVKQAGLAAILMMVSTAAMATNFRVADQVYIPVSGHLAVGSATFISDVWISNTSTTDSVTVSVIYTPSGTNPLPEYFDNIIQLAPMERKQYVDIFPALLAKNSAFGSLVFNACKTGTDCVNTQDQQGVSPNFRDIAVFSRIYSIPVGQNNPAGQPTSGQDMPGVPWYNFVSSRQASAGLNRVFIPAIVNTGTTGQIGTYRANLGLMNASQYSSTTLRIKLFSGATHQQIGNDATVNLGPLGFVQPSIGSLFPGFAPGPTSTNAYVTVEQEASSPTSDAPASCLPDGCPAFLTYASVLDNATQDATTVEGVYEKPLSENALLAIYGAKTGGKANTRRAVGRH